MKLSVCIPVYNEQDQIAETLAQLSPVLASLTPDYEIILVDDGSSDATWQRLSEAANADSRLHVLRLSRNFGKEAALCAALAEATGDAAIVMDADLQHPPSVIPELVQHWQAGYDVVEGVKRQRQRSGAGYRLLSRAFYWLFQGAGGNRLRNASDFKLMDRAVVEVWNTLPEHNTFFRGLCDWLGFNRKEVLFDVAERTNGNGKWSWRSLVKLSVNALTGFSDLPLQAVLWLGLAFVGLAVVLGIQTLVRYLLGDALGGFTTVILLLLITGGAIMVSLGIIGTYLSRVYEEVKGRPRYIVASDNRRKPNRRGRRPRPDAAPGTAPEELAAPPESAHAAE